MKNPIRSLIGKHKPKNASAVDRYYGTAVALDTERFLTLAADHAREILAGRAVAPALVREAEAVAEEIVEHSRALREQFAAELTVIRMRDHLAVEAMHQLAAADALALSDGRALATTTPSAVPAGQPPHEPKEVTA